MKLKTLKDFDCQHCNDGCDGFPCKAHTRHEHHVVNSEDLKQEAIKHIKELDAPLKRIREEPQAHESFQIQLMENNGVAPAWFTRSYDQILWIQHFFNITQEDLR